MPLGEAEQAALARASERVGMIGGPILVGQEPDSFGFRLPPRVGVWTRLPHLGVWMLVTSEEVVAPTPT